MGQSRWKIITTGDSAWLGVRRELDEPWISYVGYTCWRHQIPMWPDPKKTDRSEFTFSEGLLYRELYSHHPQRNGWLQTCFDMERLGWL